MTKSDIEKLETEVLLLEEELRKARDRIRKSGGSDCLFWVLKIQGRILDARKKIDDLKTGNERVDELTPEELEIEKKLESVESTLATK